MTHSIQDIENIYVKNVYNKISNHFDHTRFSCWNLVGKFISEIKLNSICLDLGCGNGKYLGIRDDITFYAIDNCEKLLEIVKNKYPNIKTILTDVTDTSYPDNMFDSIISIAVIHHLNSIERRIKLFNEIGRILKPGGQALITGWATKQVSSKSLNKSIKLDKQNDYLIPWTLKDTLEVFYRYYHLFEECEFENLVNQVENLKIISCVYDRDNWNIIVEKK